MLKHACALSFDESTGLPPSVELTSEELSAEQICKIAHQYGVPVIKRESLAFALKKLPINTLIPPELYEIIAALICEIQSFSAAKID